MSTGTIRNRRLQAALLRRKRACLDSPLPLLGDGLDAVIQLTERPKHWWETAIFPSGFKDRRMPICPTAVDRLNRYHDALHFHATTDHDKRAFAGEVLQIQLKRKHTLRRPLGNVVLLDNARRAWARPGGFR